MQLHQVSELGFLLRVNGILIQEVGLRVQRDRLGERDLVVVHQPLGMLSVDDRFLLELNTPEDRQWNTVRVADVRRAITEDGSYRPSTRSYARSRCCTKQRFRRSLTSRGRMPATAPR